MIDRLILQFLSMVPNTFLGMIILVAVIALCLVVLGKGADILVDEAVGLSVKWGIPKMLIGATVVSLGTTLPEVTVSVLAALNGSPDLAMGNAVGSIICDTGLILGISSIISPLPFKKSVVSRQSWYQLGSSMLLVATAFIFGGGIRAFTNGGTIPQYMGWVFLAILALYLFNTIKRSKSGEDDGVSDIEIPDDLSTAKILIKLIFGIILVVLSSKVLIPVVQEFATRIHIPETVIAATLVAFGTSLPELITGITAARKGYGDLAIGNILGADILNVLFVVGAAASVTKGGLHVDTNFFYILFPAMIFVLLVCKLAISFSKDSLKRPVGIILLSAYLIVTVTSYAVNF